MTKRKVVEKMILDFVSDVDKSGLNKERYIDIFKNMSDAQFNNYMTKMKDGEASLVIFTPIGKSKGITVANNIKVSKKYKLPLFERLRVTGDGKFPYTPEQEYLILELPLRKQSQDLEKKISVPAHNRVIDYRTGQPTGASKGSSLSQPELRSLNSLGLHNSIEEMFRFRGGDQGGFRAYNASILQTGGVSLNNIKPYLTGVESTKTVKSILAAIHLNLEI